jgi:2-keto-4-pentenoate hydratase/2-oxohepta-3-ene-1,7-dioic acid hydratase in catechol pathway
MRLFKYRQGHKSGLGILRPGHADQFIDLSALDANLSTEIATFYDAATRSRIGQLLNQAAETAFKPVSDLVFDLPIAHPGKIICMGLNYADHAKEGGHARPDYPSFFMRVDTSMTAHNQPIVRPKVSTKLDYEAELAVIIGKPAKHLNPDNALDCVFGYSCFNDGSIRDYQRKSGQWTIGKNFDKTGGFGPWVVSADELPAGAAGLRIQSRLNGKVMQDANTNDFLWNVKEALVIISECIQLMPGDVIITGTPAGVGYARTPPVFMQHGDVCEIEIEGLGILRNPIVDEA